MESLLESPNKLKMKCERRPDGLKREGGPCTTSTSRHSLPRTNRTTFFAQHSQHSQFTRNSFKMALPVVKSLADCSSLQKTVYPYMPQLYDLPQQLLQSWNNPTELQHIYLATNPLISAFAFSLFLAPVFLVISEINKNYSQVDRMWSIQ